MMARPIALSEELWNWLKLFYRVDGNLYIISKRIFNSLDILRCKGKYYDLWRDDTTEKNEEKGWKRNVRKSLNEEKRVDISGLKE